MHMVPRHLPASLRCWLFCSLREHQTADAGVMVLEVVWQSTVPPASIGVKEWKKLRSQYVGLPAVVGGTNEASN
jgi:hypothetical protein